MTTKKPLTHEDANLVLKLYDLRRESVMRDSRSAVFGKFWPKSAAEVLEVMNSPEHPINAPLRQVSSYWEMAYGFARHGIIDPDFLIETSGEGLFLYAKIAPYLQDIRTQLSPTAFQNCQWMAEQTVEGKRRYETIAARVEKMRTGK